MIYALVDISLARMETVCFIQPRRNMKTHSLILWWTLLKGLQLCFIIILVQVNLSDTIYMYRNLGIDYRTTDMMQMLPNLSNMEILHFRVSRKNVQISGPKNHENLRIINSYRQRLPKYSFVLILSVSSQLQYSV